MTPTPSPSLPQSQAAQEWLKEAERLVLIFGHAAAQGESALAEEAALLAHLAARPQEQPNPKTEAAHQVAPVGSTLPPALSEDTQRLDWLLARHLTWIPGKWGSSGRWDLYWECENSDLRAAIDAAIAAQSAQPKDAP